MTAIKTINLTKKYKDVVAVNGLSLSVQKGELFSLLGVNGAGKSTLVKLLLRFYDADEGEILYNGINVKEYNVASLRNAYATVFQDYRNFAVSVNENIMCNECTDEEKE